LSIAGGAWTRIQSETADSLVSPDRLGAILTLAKLPPAGLFTEPTAGLSGFEVFLPNCPKPLGMLAVRSYNMEIAPAAFRYRDGEYKVSYVYNGSAYPEISIVYRLGVLSLFHRFVALITFANASRYTYYFKIWTPAACAGLTTANLAGLRDAD